MPSCRRSWRAGSTRKAQVVMMTKDRDFLRLLEDQAPPPQGIPLHLNNGGNAALAAVLSATPPRA